MRASSRLGGVGIAVVALAWVGFGQEASQHPPVKPGEGGTGVEFGACVDCHADKTAGAVVHPALAVGCNGCHQVDQEDNEIQLRLVAEGNEVCFTCHEDKRPNAAQLSLHSPVRTGACTSCHDAHSSQPASLLRQATESREPAQNLCLGCHREIAAQVGKPIQHAAVDLGCATCHTTHKSDPVTTGEGIFHLNSPEPELCLGCHDANDSALEAAHLNQPFATARCSECHNPHGSDQAKLLNNFAHSPFVDKQCDVCHEAPQDGRVALAEGGRRALCLTCHSEMQERLDQAKFTHGALSAEAGCVACHSPHASAYPHQIRRRPMELCLGCHTDLARARVEKAHLHRPAFEQSCLVCHQEHTGERSARLRAEVNDLCLECHGGQNLAKLQQAGKIRLFSDAVEVEAASLAGMRILSLRAGDTRGHPFPSHPVAGEKLRNCLTCHTPHAAGGSSELLATEAASSTALCVKCH